MKTLRIDDILIYKKGKRDYGFNFKKNTRVFERKMYDL